MKMLEDLAEVMKRVNRTDCEEYALRYVEFFDEHGATIRDMAKRLEAAERDAARYRYLKVEWLDKWTDRHTGHVAGCSFRFEGQSHDIDKDIDDAMRENGQ